MKVFLVLLLILFPVTSWAGFCDPLPISPTDQILNVTPAQAGQLASIVYGAQSGTTILLDDGTYALNSSSTLHFHNSHVTLRSKSGSRDAVILDGGYALGEMIYIDSEYITIADVTLSRAFTHPVHVVGGGSYALLYNLHIIDGREQFVKVNPDSNGYADHGTLACSFLEMTDAGRAYLQANPVPGYPCYTGGLDAHQSWGWLIRDNVIANIYCTNGGLAEHAIHLWNSSREPTVERNVLFNNARGIGFGLGNTGGQRIYLDDPLAGSGFDPGAVQHIGGTIKNNFISATIPEFDTGIGLEAAWNVNIFHNSVFATKDPSQCLGIDIRFASSNAALENNLSLPAITTRNGAVLESNHGNLVASQGMFVDPLNGNLHLVSNATAIGKGVHLPSVSTDMDGEYRKTIPDVGADEFVAALYVSRDAKNGSCNGDTPCFPNIREGIASVSAPSIIKITGETYDEGSIILDVDQTITLNGGWDANFVWCSSYTIINGSMTISDGTIIIENIILK